MCHGFYSHLDVDECAESPCNSALNSTCQNTDGSFRCICPVGLNGDGIDTCFGKLLTSPRHFIHFR